MSTGKKEIAKIARGSLQIESYAEKLWVSWKSVTLCYFKKNEDKWYYHNYLNNNVPDQEVEEEEINDYAIARCIENIDELKSRFEEEKKRNIEHRKMVQEENAKFYHLELKDLTKKHNLYYSDIISTRLSNVLNFIGKYTLEELSELSPKYLLSFRTCGKKSIEEIESLFKHVGLDWKDSSK